MMTNKGLEMLGFTPLRDGESLTAQFYLLRTFCLRGIKLPDGSAIVDYTGRLATDPPGDYRLLIGSDPEALLREALSEPALLRQVTVKAEKGEAPPYAALITGPTKSSTVTEGYYKRGDDCILTHDLFPKARDELEHRRREIIEPVVASLPIVFAAQPHPITVYNPSQLIVGITSDGEAISDGRITLSGSAYVSAPVDLADVRTALMSGPAVHAHLGHGLLQFYYLGMHEADPLKAFLYYFLFIERLTHAAFHALRRSGRVGAVLAAPDRLSAATADFAVRSYGRATSLADRFYWAAVLAWPAITDDDVAAFVRLKKARDRLSHGALTVVNPSLARDASVLATALASAWVMGARALAEEDDPAP